MCVFVLCASSLWVHFSVPFDANFRTCLQTNRSVCVGSAHMYVCVCHVFSSSFHVCAVRFSEPFDALPTSVCARVR